MKIAAIMGSPHKGASYSLTEEIEKKLKQLGDVEFDYIHLKDLDLKPCRGCFNCFLNGKEACPLEDDREIIENIIDEADGIIFVSPVYSMHVSYLMKLFIDRFSYTFHRPGYFRKYALAVSTTGNLGLKETLKYLRGVALCWGFRFVDQIGAVRPPKPLPLIKAQKDRTAEAAEKLKKISPVPRDYTYWDEKGMFDAGKKYYTEEKNSVFGNILAQILTRPMTGQIEKALNKSGNG